MASQASELQIQELYIAYFGRPADPDGLAFYADALDLGTTTIADIAGSFDDSAEAQAIIVLSTDEYLAAVYLQAFGRAYDESVDGTFWKDAINNAATTKEAAMIEILNGAQAADVTSVENKVTVATTFTAAVSSGQITYTDASDITAAKDILSQVTSDAATIATGQAAVEAISTPVSETNSLVGTWSYSGPFTEDGLTGTKDITLTFNEDGTYQHSEAAGGELAGGAGGGVPGSETGTYSWNESTGMLSVQTVTSDTNGTWGLSDLLANDESAELVITGDSMAFADETFTFTKAVQASNSLIGFWSYSGPFVEDGLTGTKDITLTFNDDGTYLHTEAAGGELANGAGGGVPGSEAGTYSWDESTGLLSVLSVTSDNNGTWGLSDAVGGDIEMVIVGSSLSAVGDDFSFTMG